MGEAGSIAEQTASHAVDMVGDLKTGHILGASPLSQFWAQLAGSFLGIWLSVAIFILFATAYPCITDLDVHCTAFGMPAAQAWRSVTEAVTRPEVCRILSRFDRRVIQLLCKAADPAIFGEGFDNSWHRRWHHGPSQATGGPGKVPCLGPELECHVSQTTLIVRPHVQSESL